MKSRNERWNDTGRRPETAPPRQPLRQETDRWTMADKGGRNP